MSAINVSPYGTNVLDLIGMPLKSSDGRDVIVKRSGMVFMVYVDGVLYKETDDNLSASYVLNSLQVTR